MSQISAPRSEAALPKIEVSKDGKYFRVDWDYQEAPESRVLLENKLLEGYIWGVIATLCIADKCISCATPRTGTIKRLEKDVALRFAELLTEALHPTVAREYQRLKREASWPHVRYAQENSAP
ncbi:hypothetical protein [Pseudomonas chlororaphis]